MFVIKQAVQNSVEWALLVALVLGTGPMAQAHEEVATQNADPPQVRYWVGILGAPVTPALRVHLNLPEEGEGLLVRGIVPKSPAEEAGLKKHDILLRGNDTRLQGMRDLAELVRVEGEKQGQITLEIVRRGQRETVWIKPVQQPAQAEAHGFGAPRFGAHPPHAARPFPLGNREGQFEFRDLERFFGRPGPGIAPVPNGVSIRIHKENDQPAHITVERGNETWEIIGDNPESLEQLPEDLRPAVAQMLQGQALPNRPLGPGGQGDQIPDWQQFLPQMEHLPGRLGPELQRRLEGMERQMRQFRGQSSQPDGSPAKEKQRRPRERGAI